VFYGSVKCAINVVKLRFEPISWGHSELVSESVFNN
jgi:hypothetical protein